MCQFADRLASGNPCLIGLFSRMGVRQFPTQLDPAHLVVEIECEPGETGIEYPMEARFIDEDGHVLTSWGGRMEVPPMYDYMPARTCFMLPIPWDEHFVFTGPGVYRFDVVVHPGTPEEIVLGGETLVVVQGDPQVPYMGDENR